MDIENARAPASSPPSLDAIWLCKPSSPAARMAAASRTFHELDEAAQAAWGPRYAQVFQEFHGKIDPLATDGSELGAKEIDSSVDNLRHSMAWAFWAALCQRGSCEALISCFAALPAPKVAESSVSTDPSLVAQRIFEHAVERLGKLGRFDELARMVEAGGVVRRHCLPNLLARDGAALDHRILREAAQSALKEFSEPGKGFDNGRATIAAQHHPREFRICPHPAWRAMLLDSFRRGEPDRLELTNLALTRSYCNMTAAATPEAMAAAAAKDRKNKKSFTRTSYAPEQREAARALGEMARLRWIEGATAIAKSTPSLAARIVMEGGAARAKLDTWVAIGLSTVDAGSFLFDAYPSLSGGVSPAKERPRCWPAFDDGAGRSALEGVGLNFLDCLALSGSSKEDLESIARLGNAPSDGLLAAAELQQVKRTMNVAEQLWLASFVGSPAPNGSRRILRV